MDDPRLCQHSGIGRRMKMKQGSNAVKYIICWDKIKVAVTRHLLWVVSAKYLRGGNSNVFIIPNFSKT